MSSSLVTPLLIYRPFGANAANPTYINIPIPDPSQIGTTINAASFNDGFPPATMTPEVSGGLPFFGQDMNGILWMISAYCANFAAGALSSYNATLSTNINGYPVGAIVVNANGNGAWFNQTSGNTTDPDTGGAGWLPIAGVGLSTVSLSSSNVTLTALQSALPLIVLQGTLTANVNVVFPENVGQQWIVANGTTGSHTVTCKTVAGGAGVVVPQTGYAAPTSIYCDGSGNIQNTGVSTAGLAPINSPTLTGTPTAPTASPATTNTTQIATTAFVQAAITAALTIYAKLASPIFSGTPTAPTASPGTNTTQLATTAFVQAAVTAATTTVVQGGSFTNTAGLNTSVTFSTPFPTTCTGVNVTPNYASPDVGWIVPGSITRTGFVWFNANAGVNSFVAVGS